MQSCKALFTWTCLCLDSKKIKLKDIHAVQESICLTKLLQNYDVHSKCLKKMYIMELI